MVCWRRWQPEVDQTMRLKKGGIQIKTSKEQEGIYRGKRSILLRGFHVDPTYTTGKALSICPLEVPWELVWAPLASSSKLNKNNMRERTEARSLVIG